MKCHHTSTAGPVLLHALLTFNQCKEKCMQSCTPASLTPTFKTAYAIITTMCILGLQKDAVSLVLFCSSGT